MSYAIEQNVPLPPPDVFRAPKPESLTSNLRAMEVGDSLLIDRPQSSLGIQTKLFPKKFTTRKVSDTQTRIWRVA